MHCLSQLLVLIVVIVAVGHEPFASAAPTQTASETEIPVSVSIVASQDAAICEDPSGDSGNSRGPDFPVGRTNQAKNSLRRALMAFDLSAYKGYRAEQAVLQLYAIKSNHAGGSSTLIQAFRVTRAWQEGTSNSTGGMCTTASGSDVTWIYSDYSDQTQWSDAGGDFSTDVSAQGLVGGSKSQYNLTGDQLVEDVNHMIKHPSDNHGWILQGNEGAPKSSILFASREAETEDVRPRLLLVVHEHGSSGPSASVGIGLGVTLGIILAALLLMWIGSRRRSARAREFAEEA